ncbi:hypothetical protein [Sulfolobus acidocaldarius]|uniref:S-rich protein n=4 Tax=Sulfolobus acidocaldarius TaxID=2285 RepID=Q4J6T3_SULAC|nr:hypothetical protein [Sulfolobus acidocaldarius]AAY81500.1 S-rich protein [Sulfolobus acidocaldarius DSM 639]AGE72105.1 S-rich protein [Sulfolobus acidocaldarius N8]AGE74422.1 S-rich protein [Sulfolobus acidocaldarius Ron12/I]ALU29718.1 hypothetical protein ATY89_07030 [Sulfolobus acidocaldarius]ALU32454.1 hypothetical protein ATZ20_10050 [Sulfolobus acidocaldarius]
MKERLSSVLVLVISISLLAISIYPYTVFNSAVGYYPQLLYTFQFPLNSTSSYGITYFNNGLVIPAVSIKGSSPYDINISYIYLSSENTEKLILNYTLSSPVMPTVSVSSFTDGHYLGMYYGIKYYNNIQSGTFVNSSLYNRPGQFIMVSDAYTENVILNYPNEGFNLSMVLISYEPNQWWFYYPPYTTLTPLTGMPTAAYGIAINHNYKVIILGNSYQGSNQLIAYLATNPSDPVSLSVIANFTLPQEIDWIASVNNLVYVDLKNTGINVYDLNLSSPKPLMEIGSIQFPLSSTPLGVINSSLYIIGKGNGTLDLVSIHDENIKTVSQLPLISNDVQAFMVSQNISIANGNKLYLVNTKTGYIFNITLNNPLIIIGNQAYSAYTEGSSLIINVYEIKYGVIPTSTTSQSTPTSTSNTSTSISTTSVSQTTSSNQATTSSQVSTSLSQVGESSSTSVSSTEPLSSGLSQPQTTSSPSISPFIIVVIVVVIIIVIVVLLLVRRR